MSQHHYPHPVMIRFCWFLVYAGLAAVLGIIFAWITDGNKAVEAATLLLVVGLLLIGVAETLRTWELLRALEAQERALLSRPRQHSTPVQRFPGYASETSIHSGQTLASSAPQRHLHPVGMTGPQTSQ